MDTKSINEITNKISLLLKEYNVKSNINISQNTKFGFKIDIVAIEEDKVKDLNNMNKRISIGYGFTQNIIGMEFDSQTKGKISRHKIVGFKTQNTKYPIITNEIGTGASYKFPVSQVKQKLGGDKQINRSANLDNLLEN